jgi:hypothetical protein
MSEEEGDYKTIRIPKELAEEVDHLIGTKGYNVRVLHRKVGYQLVGEKKPLRF